MMMRMILVSVLCGAGSATALADVSLQFSPTTVPVNQLTQVELSLLVNDGLESTIGAIIMDFEEGIGLSAINPVEFVFDSAFDKEFKALIERVLGESTEKVLQDVGVA